MTHFSVDPDELRALGRTLADFHGRLSRVTARMSSLSSNETGHHGLAAALETFGQDWAFSLAKIKEHAEDLAGLLSQAADTYREVDDEIARATGD